MRKLIAALLIGAASLMLAAPAQATWNLTANEGHGCRFADQYHCYAFEGYYGGPRQGGIVNIKTDQAYTQYNDTGFITHEMWQSFRDVPGNGGPTEGWVETGQISDGEGRMHPFFAAKVLHPPPGQDGFYIYEQEGTVPLNTWHEYLMMWDGGTCFHILWGAKASPASWIVVHTYCGFRAPEEIEAGIEVATEREPYSAGFAQLAIERNNTWSENWDRGYVVYPGFYLHRIQGSLISFGVCCGQAPWNGGHPSVASIAKKAGTTTTSRTANMGGGETLYVYEGKYHLNVPVPPGGNKAPKGTVLAFLTTPTGWIKGRYIGQAQPNVEEMRGPGWEMQ